ncbi:hypothetical protein [Candidatus Colwellia aromaticivorans]|uniref:hypothetical protein n=1 Tax=Candidatus Colwellia aromaticivorans TaxID=2267621 RepID=UPI000DF1D199|nr:hypothetical protein [Candidatus Colwellia aromaticivorans]
MKILKSIKKRFFNKEFKIRKASSTKQSIIIKNDKSLSTNDEKSSFTSLQQEKGLAHELVLAMNEKLSVYGIGEVSSYDYNKQGELVMDLSIYKTAS